MAQTATENRMCRKCGVEVRPNTLFCYNCGFSVAPVDADGNNLPTVRDKLIEEEKAAAPLPEKHFAAAGEAAKMRSAAPLQKSRSAIRKSVEVVWEEPESAPNVWFLVVAFGLTLFAAAILAAMLYIR